MSRRQILAIVVVAIIGCVGTWYLFVYRPKVQKEEALTNDEIQSCLNRDPKTFEQLLADLELVSSESKVEKIKSTAETRRDGRKAIAYFFDRLSSAKKHYPGMDLLVFMGDWKARGAEVRPEDVAEIYYIYGLFAGPGKSWGAGGHSAGWQVLVDKDGNLIAWTKFEGGPIPSVNDFGVPSKKLD